MEGEGGREEEAPEEDGGGKRENIVNIPNYYVWGIRDIDILRRAFLVWRFLLYPKATLSFIWRHNACLLPPLPAFFFRGPSFVHRPLVGPQIVSLEKRRPREERGRRHNL